MHVSIQDISLDLRDIPKITTRNTQTDQYFNLLAESNIGFLEEIWQHLNIDRRGRWYFNIFCL